MTRMSTPRRMSRSARSTVLVCLLTLAAASPSGADVVPLTLFERTGRAPLVVWGEITDGAHRFAVVRTDEVLRCSIRERPGGTFRIAFRLDSFLRTPWQDKIEFKTGERVILFLRKFTKEDGRQPDGDLYTLMWGAQGKHLLPLEGEQAQVEAVRRFAAILSAPNDQQAPMLRMALSDPNPMIADGAFEEAVKQGIGDLGMIPQLTALLSSERETPRVGSLRLMAQIFSDARIAGREIPRREELSDLLRGRIRTDPAVPFRVQAIATLGELGGDDNKAFVERVAQDDPSQLVRYEAHKALSSWR
jgi:hypothetical protein